MSNNSMSCTQVMAMADARREGLVMLINPQWQQGQVRAPATAPRHT